jgi:hypothetical protein
MVRTIIVSATIAAAALAAPSSGVKAVVRKLTAV